MTSETTRSKEYLEIERLLNASSTPAITQANILIETPPLVRLWAEFLATFISIIGAVGCSIAFPFNNLNSMAVGGGLSIGAAMFAFFSESRAHTNPMATLADVALKRIEWYWLFPYWLVQLAACFAATGLILSVLPPSQWSFVVPVFGPTIDYTEAVMAEFLGSFLLRLVMLGTTETISDAYFEHKQRLEIQRRLASFSQDDVSVLKEPLALVLLLGESHSANQNQLNRVTGALAIDLIMTALITVFGPISGNSLFNPFRHLAAASLVNGWLTSDWVYYIGPIAGTLLSILVYLPIQLVRNRIRQNRKLN